VEDRGVAAYVAEFVGTFFLVLFVVVILALNSQAGLGFTDFAVIGLVHAFILMVLIQTLGGTSGAHFNPAVTVALTAIRKIAPVEAATYIVLQLAGGVAATLVAKLIILDEGRAGNYGAATVSEQFLQGKTLSGALVELIGAFILMWAIMGLAVDPRGARNWAGFGIGAALGTAVMTFGPLTGGSFNPARAFGPALVSSTFDGVGKFLVVYVLAPALGALIAAIGYRALVLNPQDRMPGERPIDKLD
jgi:glycerol uptake facilitator protein